MPQMQLPVWRAFHCLRPAGQLCGHGVYSLIKTDIEYLEFETDDLRREDEYIYRQGKMTKCVTLRDLSKHPGFGRFFDKHRDNVALVEKI